MKCVNVCPCRQNFQTQKLHVWIISKRNCFHIVGVTVNLSGTAIKSYYSLCYDQAALAPNFSCANGPKLQLLCSHCNTSCVDRTAAQSFVPHLMRDTGQTDFFLTKNLRISTAHKSGKEISGPQSNTVAGWRQERTLKVQNANNITNCPCFSSFLDTGSWGQIWGELQ